MRCVDALRRSRGTVAVQCICRGHQRKECACTDQCRQQRCGSHMISPINVNVNGTPVASNWSRTFFEQTSFKAALFAPAVPEIQKALEGLKGRSRCVLAALPLAISRDAETDHLGTFASHRLRYTKQATLSRKSRRVAIARYLF